MLGLTPESQNLRSETNFMRSRLEVLTSLSEDPLYKECLKRLDEIESILNSLSYCYRSLYIWLNLHWISQQLVMLVDNKELYEIVASLEDALSRVPVEEGGTHYKNMKQISEDKDEPKIENLRGKIKTARKFLDDRSDTVLWQSIVTNWTLFFLSVALLILLFVTYELLTSSDGKEVLFSLMIVFGSIGGALSSLVGVLDRSDYEGPPLVGFAVNMCRPIIGAIAGMSCFLVFKSGFVSDISVHGEYIIALAFGFSERIFITKLQDIARSSDKSWRNTLGSINK